VIGPQECRDSAVRCAEIAQEAQDPALKQVLTETAKAWLKLAIELERSQTLRDQKA